MHVTHVALPRRQLSSAAAFLSLSLSPPRSRRYCSFVCSSSSPFSFIALSAHIRVEWSGLAQVQDRLRKQDRKCQ